MNLIRNTNAYSLNAANPSCRLFRGRCTWICYSLNHWRDFECGGQSCIRSEYLTKYSPAEIFTLSHPASSSGCVKETSMSRIRGQHRLTERQRQSGWWQSERQSCFLFFFSSRQALRANEQSSALTAARPSPRMWSRNPDDSVTPPLEAPALQLRLDKSRLIVCGCLRVQRQILGSKD